jgi:hypothetical protein
LPNSLNAPPITKEIMIDPVICADGFTYDRPSIQQWFDLGHDISPITGQILTNTNLIPNRALKSTISVFLETIPEEQRAMIVNEERRASKFSTFLEGYTQKKISSYDYCCIL